jgi:hypothetical protein
MLQIAPAARPWFDHKAAPVLRVIQLGRLRILDHHPSDELKVYAAALAMAPASASFWPDLGPRDLAADDRRLLDQ